MLVSVNPATGDTAYELQPLDSKGIGDLIESVDTAGEDWRRLEIEERADMLRAVAAQLRADKDKLAHWMTVEMGKPAKEAGPEVEKGAWCAEHYADHAAEYLKNEVIASDASESYVHYEPLGVILSILPWNAPVWLAMRALAPALMAGNTCVMKHDPNVPGCGEAIEAVFRAAGLPENAMRNLPVATEQVEQAIKHPAVQAVSFTGSSKAGSIVAATAAAEIKHAVLELGGSDPMVVLADADLEAAANVATLSRIINAGQSCIAAKRIIIEASIYDRFTEMLKERLAALKVGDPAQADTDVGPIARADLRENLHRQIRATVDTGARCLLGGEMPDGPGFFYPCTLLADVAPDMCAFREETFGPVMTVVRAVDADEALTLANQTDYGLGASVWTRDPVMGRRFAHALQAGQVAVNGIVKTDPRLPSGGIKRSGYGRELGPHGIREFTNAKQVWIK